MNIRQKLALFFAVFSFFQVAFLTAQRAAPTILFAADEWAPFNMTPGSQEEGYIIDILRWVYEPLGYKVEYRIVPWKRTIDGTQSGIYHGAVGASKSDGEGLLFPEEELAINRLGFFTPQGKAWRFTRSSIAQVSLGVIDGYDYRKWLSDYIGMHRNDPTRIQVMSGDNPLEKNIRKLLLGRVDVVVDSTTAIRYTAQKMGVLDQLRNAGEDSELAFIYVAFSPVKPESRLLASQLTDGIRRLRTSGELKEILVRYGLEDWK